jgi:hypothetical protein
LRFEAIINAIGIGIGNTSEGRVGWLVSGIDFGGSWQRRVAD